MSRRTDDAERGLLPSNHEALNKEFYEGRPWLYFDRRLVQLARVAAQTGDDGPTSSTFKLGPLEIREERRELAPDEPVGLDDQSFVATEAQVLLHHASETLLRLFHAHAPAADGTYPPCPWLAMSRVRSARDFKAWVRANVLACPPPERTELVRQVLGDTAGDAESVTNIAEHLRLCAEHFLDADSYNAAKHGLGVQGARSQLTVDVDDQAMIDEQGLTITWLAVRGADPRWARTTRWFSLEATVGLAYIAARLMQALWYAARARYLADPIDKAFVAPRVSDLLGPLNVLHPVLAEVDELLAYDGSKPTLRIRKRLKPA